MTTKSKTKANLEVHINATHDILDKIEEAANLTITKVKLSDKNTLDISYVRRVNDEIIKQTFSSNAEIHPDLKEAMDLFKPHLAVIADQREAFKKSNLDAIDVHCYEMGGITITGAGDEEGIILSGRKNIGVKILNINSPVVKWQGDMPVYKFLDELSEANNVFMHEVSEYMNGKHSVIQQTMFEEGSEESDDAAAATN